MAALALSPLTCKKTSVGSLTHIGLQLYSVRDPFEKNPADTLRQLAEMGYNQLESYERSLGMFWGMTNKGFKKYMDELGMELISAHCEIEKDFEQKAAEAAEIGMKYLVYNWPFAQQSLDQYKQKAELFNRCGEICKKQGIRFGYHNYESSFRQVEGVYPHDLLMERTDPHLVDHQMDIYYVVAAGQDPVYWLNKYPNRFRLCHVKDLVKSGSEKTETCDLGKGIIDFTPILKTANDQGMQYYFAEQEHYPRSTPMKSAKANADFLRSLKF